MGRIWPFITRAKQGVLRKIVKVEVYDPYITYGKQSDPYFNQFRQLQCVRSATIITTNKYATIDPLGVTAFVFHGYEINLQYSYFFVAQNDSQQLMRSHSATINAYSDGVIVW